MHFLSSHFIWFCSYQKHKITWHFKEIQIHDKDYCRVSLTHIKKCNFSRKTKNRKNCKKHEFKKLEKISEKRHKIWTRQSTFAGGPTVVRKDSSGPGKIRPNSSYGFGSRIDRFTAIQSTPTSPMVETNPLKWFVKEIDISDSAKNPTPNKKSSSNQRTEMFGHRPIRTRSRHDCHFSTGSSVPMGNLSPF